ncbi:hypothetical protein KKG41_03755 [Patescibacteria group bacterium]|nr:hypothetical protein [Patescibacteria group bacterium]MBU1890275.1 hypothetical protein [Patescibacteria group bacterium]
MNEIIQDQIGIEEKPEEVRDKNHLSSELLTIIIITVIILLAIGILYYFESTSSFVTNLAHTVSDSLIE